MTTCDFVKSSILSYLQSETEILSTKRSCIVSLPMKVLDGVNVEVYVEEMADGYNVHDGGRSLGTLESSGLLVGDKKIDLLSQLAGRMGANFHNGVFSLFTKKHNVQHAVFSIGQCCSVAMYELLRHSPSTEEERIKSRVLVDVERWGETHGVEISAGRRVDGQVKQYMIDFVAETTQPIAINVLVPSYNSAVSAERYCLQLLDMGKAAGYKRLAVLAKPRLWKKASRLMIGKLADGVAEIDDEGSLFPNNIADNLDLLAAA